MSKDSGWFKFPKCKAHYFRREKDQNFRSLCHLSATIPDLAFKLESDKIKSSSNILCKKCLKELSGLGIKGEK